MHGGAKGRPQNEFTRVKFRVKAPLGHGETVGVVGDSRSLGNFNPNGAITLVTSPETYPIWSNAAPLLVPKGVQVKYKYVVFSGGRLKSWEPIAGDRVMIPNARVVTVTDIFARPPRHPERRVETGAHSTLTQRAQSAPVEVTVPVSGARAADAATASAASARTAPSPSVALAEDAPAPGSAATDSGAFAAGLAVAASEASAAAPPPVAQAPASATTAPSGGEASGHPVEPAPASLLDQPAGGTSAALMSPLADTAALDLATVCPGRMFYLCYELPLRIALRRDGTWEVAWRKHELNARADASIADSVKTLWVGLVPEVVVEQEGDAPPELRHVTQQEFDSLRPLLEGMACLPLFADMAVRQQHTEGYCMKVLWPMFHNVLDVFTRPDGRTLEALFRGYAALNAVFSDCVLALYQPGDTVWVQDLELMLVPRQVRQALTERAMEGEHPVPAHFNIIFFLHQPFPTSEIFRSLHTRTEVLEGILAADMVGFHVFNYARHFLNSCKRYLGLSYQSRQGGNLGVDYRGRNVMVTVSHVSVEAEVLQAAVATQAVLARAEALREKHQGRVLVAGMDKCERLQGVALKLLAFERLITEYPVWRDKVVLVQRCTMRRARAEDCRVTSRENKELVARVAARGGCVDYEERDVPFEPEERLALWLAADVLLQTPISEGFNLLPLEYMVARSSNRTPGVLVLSEFSASNHVLNGCLRVNPYNIGSVATALDTALTMTRHERSARFMRDFPYVSGRSSRAWMLQVLSDMRRALTQRAQLTAVDVEDEAVNVDAPTGHELGVQEQFASLDPAAVVEAYKASRRRLFVLNYGGTLVLRENVEQYFKSDYVGVSLRAPAPRTLAAVRALADNVHNEVFIVSGAAHDRLEATLGAVKSLNLVAESGVRFSWGSKANALAAAASADRVCLSDAASGALVSGPDAQLAAAVGGSTGIIGSAGGSTVGGVFSALAAPAVASAPVAGAGSQPTSPLPAPRKRECTPAADSLLALAGSEALRTLSPAAAAATVAATAAAATAAPATGASSATPGTPAPIRSSNAVTAPIPASAASHLAWTGGAFGELSPAAIPASFTPSDGRGAAATTPARRWQEMATDEARDDMLWKQVARDIIEPYTWRTNGSSMAETELSVTWDYRYSDPQWGSMQAKNLTAELRAALKDMAVWVVKKKGLVEVGAQSTGKGSAVEEILQAVPDADFVLCVGDDAADESMFTALYTHMGERVMGTVRRRGERSPASPSAPAAASDARAAAATAAAGGQAGDASPAHPGTPVPEAGERADTPVPALCPGTPVPEDSAAGAAHAVARSPLAVASPTGAPPALLLRSDSLDLLEGEPMDRSDMDRPASAIARLLTHEHEAPAVCDSDDDATSYRQSFGSSDSEGEGAEGECKVFTVTVGMKPSHARMYVHSTNEVVELLRMLADAEGSLSLSPH